MIKICKICLKTKGLRLFPWQIRNGEKYFRPVCRDCSAERRKAYRKERPEVYLQIEKRYFAKIKQTGEFNIRRRISINNSTKTLKNRYIKMHLKKQGISINDKNIEIKRCEILTKRINKTVKNA